MSLEVKEDANFLKLFCTYFSCTILSVSDTDEELQEWKTKFDEKIASLESNISKLEREMNDMETKGSFLKQNLNEYIREISRLQTEAEVILMKLIHIQYLKNVKFMAEVGNDSLSFEY